MLDFALVLVFIFAISALLGHIAHVRASPEKRAWYMQVKGWKARQYVMALFIGCITSLFILMAISKLAGWKLPAPYALGVLSAVGLSALLYLGVSGRKCFAKLAQHKGLLKTVGGMLAVCFVTASKIFADMAIAELANLPPQELPGAQLLLTVIMQPALALTAAALFLGYASVPLTFIALAWWIHQEIKATNGARPTLLTASYTCTILAIVISTVILLTLTHGMLTKSFYEKRLRSAIVHSAFHLPPSYCGLPDAEGAAVAPLKYHRAALAMPDQDKGYVFSTLPCAPKMDTPQALATRLSEKATAANITN